MSMQISPTGYISIDGIDTGMSVKQLDSGTVVFVREVTKYVSSNPVAYKAIEMPQKRYALAHSSPESGVSGVGQFETDLRKIIGETDPQKG